MTQPPDETDPLAKQPPWGEEPTAYRPPGPDLGKPVSPSGDQPLGPPSPPDPTTPYATTPPPGPYPQPPYPQQPYPQPYPPQPGPPPGAYGAPYGTYPVPGAPGYPFGQAHGGANTAMGLGITSAVCAVLTFFCCFTVVGTVAGPIAIVLAMRARKEMEQSPGLYNNPGAALTGLITGIVGTVLGLLAVGLVVFFFGSFLAVGGY